MRVTLVGHSMGTIILNRVVRDASKEFADIVYLAAACSVEDFSRYANDGSANLKQRPHFPEPPFPSLRSLRSLR